MCTIGCEVCKSGLKKQPSEGKSNENGEKYEKIANSIQEIRKNLTNGKKNKAFESTEVEDDSVSDEWEVIRGSFVHIALWSNATLWDVASGGGLSKYGHLGDGFIDLILVDQVSRKDFYRFLKRHTNLKDQVRFYFQSIPIQNALLKILFSLLNSSAYRLSNQFESKKQSSKYSIRTTTASFLTFNHPSTGTTIQQ